MKCCRKCCPWPLINYPAHPLINDIFSDGENVPSALDVGSLLKQWLRELPEPLIPHKFHETFLKCCKLSDQNDLKIEAIITASLLLPPLHSASLTILMRFLSDVAKASQENKMNAKNLAIIFMPCLLPMENLDVNNCDDDIANRIEIVEALIKNSNSVCMIDQKIKSAQG